MGRDIPVFKMSRDRKCILCETVCFSKQEMVQHMRSMLHHRELETLKGRDCGHECRECKVKVVSLAEYASHLSSASHKRNVETADQKLAGSNCEEDYLDQALVDLIEKRKEQIRKDKEAAAAKLEREENERRRKEGFQQRLREAKEQYRREVNWHQPPQMYGDNSFDHHNSWYNDNQDYGRPREIPPWHNTKQGKSATWHAQEPPNFQKWASADFADGRMNNQECRSNRTWGQGSFSRGQQNRHPWLSNAGSSNGLYGRNTIGQHNQRGSSQRFFEPRAIGPPPLPNFSHSPNHFQNQRNDQHCQQGAGIHNEEEQSIEFDHSSSKSSKTFGSNPKVDKACRWSPYPVTKSSESVHQNEINQSSSEKSSKFPKPQRSDKPTEASSYNRQSQPEQKAPLISRRQSVEDVRKHQINLTIKPRDRSSSSNRGGNSQRDGPKILPSSDQKVNRPPQKSEHKVSPIPDVSSVAQLGENSSRGQTQSRPTENPSKLQSLPARLLSRSDRQLLETLRKAKQIVARKKGTLDNSGPNKTETAKEEQKSYQVQNLAGTDKENNHQPNAVKQGISDSFGPEKPVLPTSDSCQFLQSLQVSTSTMETSEPSLRDDEENRSKAEGEMCSGSQDEAMQVSEAGQSSGLSKLDLPPVLKRDLTKHISTKSKAIGHEPNLNIARRVRNLGESRRSDSEKDSRLKPNVRQLINSSSSRRNVNWEQVYQEVRKKQDKGKGMPRFGIEVVPQEQENQNQEEDDLSLLEGFHWESVMGISPEDTSEKHSLSENYLTPASINSLYSSSERSEKEDRNSVQQASIISSTLGPSQENPNDQCQVQVDQKLVKVKTEKQTEEATSSAIKALQRSDSVLGDSSSGTEQCDGQGTGKRRRAAVDIPSTESSCLEHNSKRRKVKTKQERSHIDQLLAVSLREEELSRSLQTVDTNLIQARAALEAAYIEVQRLIVVKQQMTGEMGTLRNKRIELLKGMQDSVEEAPTVKLKEEKMDSPQTEPCIPSSLPLSSAADTAAQSPNQAAVCASPPSSSLPFMAVVIKEEPMSPVHIYSESEPVDNISHSAHSTTPELPAPPSTASVPDPAPSLQPPSKSPPIPELFKIKVEEPASCNDNLHEASEPMERVLQTECNGLTSDSKTALSPPLLSRRDSDAVECGDVALFRPPAVTSVVPTSPSDLRTGKRVRKLKKRKSLKKSPGPEEPETSDTEMDEGALRPRWLQARRRPSGGSQVSSSSLPTEEGDANPEDGKKTVRQQLLVKLERIDQKTLSKMMELPHEVTADPVAQLDAEESMEVTVAPQQPTTLEDFTPHADPEPSRSEPQSLTCMSLNEVSSTSDMDLCRSSESDMPFAITSPKNSSDAFSDHGEDELPTEGVFEGHQEAVNAIQIYDGLLYTCSGDRTVKAFDLVSHKCVGVFEGHSSKVNCLLVSATPSLHHRLYSGSSDQTIRCYSLKTRELEQQFSLSDRVLCLHSRWRTLYAGLANGTVVTFNLKTNKQMDVFECHAPRAVSCLASSQEGARRILLVGSYDNTISVRDAKNGLLLRLLEGHTKTVLCMKVVNDLVFSGSSDQCVFAHNIHTGEQVRVYKGHSHAVTVVAVLGNVMVTACLDKLVRVYDLQSHEQLQVYSGHKDMVMCMAVHKNLIYTGCYDGSVQAVKLNLMQNHRCWWHGCSLVFGVTEHLKQHLIKDHTSTNSQTLKCRWKNCEEFFSSRNSSIQVQGMLLHLQKHAEEETEVEPYLH